MAVIAFLMDIQEGHILPSFGLGSVLRKRGHRVIYISVFDNEELVKEQGFEFYPVFGTLYPKGFNERYKRMGQNNENANKEHLSHIGQLMNGALDAFFDQFNPDLFITSVFLKLETLILHYKYKISPVIFIPYLIGQGEDLIGDCMEQIMHFPGDKLHLIIECLKGLGVRLTSLIQLVQPLNTFPALVACPEELDIFQPDRSRNIQYLSPLIRSGHKTGDSRFLSHIPAGKKIIYASFGSQLPVYGEMVRAFFRKLINIMNDNEMQDFHLILSTGTGTGEHGPAPENLTVLQWAPQIDILKVADIAIIHGGLGTIKECIYFGVPMLVLPLTRDQPLNARRVEMKGLGFTDKIDSMTEDSLKEAILSLGNNDYIRENIAKMRKIFEFKQDIEYGVDFIESLFSSELQMRSIDI